MNPVVNRYKLRTPLQLLAVRDTVSIKYESFQSSVAGGISQNAPDSAEILDKKKERHHLRRFPEVVNEEKIRPPRSFAELDLGAHNVVPERSVAQDRGEEQQSED